MATWSSFYTHFLGEKTEELRWESHIWHLLRLHYTRGSDSLVLIMSISPWNLLESVVVFTGLLYMYVNTSRLSMEGTFNLCKWQDMLILIFCHAAQYRQRWMQVHCRDRYLLFYLIKFLYLWHTKRNTYKSRIQ